MRLSRAGSAFTNAARATSSTRWSRSVRSGATPTDDTETIRNSIFISIAASQPISEACWSTSTRGTYQNWGLLTQALRTGAPQSGGVGTYKTLHDGHPMQEIFLNGMTAGSLLAARAIAAKFPWRKFSTMIDIGTAQGGAAVEIARAHPHLTGGGFDLPPVEPIFTRYVERQGLSDRLRFHAGDFFSDPLPSADVLVMGRILHNWDLPTRKMLIAKAYRALPPGGVLIVYDPLIDDDRCADQHGLLSSLNMLIETAGGSEYTGADCKEWMRQAGFVEINQEPLGDMHTAIIGHKTL